VRSEGHEVALPTWRAAQAEDWLGRWAMNLMLIKGRYPHEVNFRCGKRSILRKKNI